MGGIVGKATKTIFKAAKEQKQKPDKITQTTKATFGKAAEEEELRKRKRQGRRALLSTKTGEAGVKSDKLGG